MIPSLPAGAVAAAMPRVDKRRRGLFGGAYDAFRALDRGAQAMIDGDPSTTLQGEWTNRTPQDMVLPTGTRVPLKPKDRPAGLFGGAARWATTPDAEGFNGLHRIAMALGDADTRQDIRQQVAGRQLRTAFDGLLGELPTNDLPGGGANPMASPAGPVTGGAGNRVPVADRVTALQRAILKAAESGANVTPYLKMLDAYTDRSRRDAFLSTVPQADRSLAAMDPDKYVSHALDLRKPRASEDLIKLDPNTGQYGEVFDAPEKLPPGFRVSADGKSWEPVTGGPADPKYVRETAYNRADGQRDAAPPAWVVYGPQGGGGRIDSTGDVLAPILSKVAAGQQLSPGEQTLFDRWNNSSGSDDPVRRLLSGAGGGGVGGGMGGDLDPPSRRTAPSPAPSRPAAPPAPSPARPASPPAMAGTAKNPHRPRSRAEAQALPRGAYFVDPAGNVIQKK